MPKTWVNFVEVREKVSLEDVIYRYYGLTTLTRQGTKLVGPCPVHGGDSPRAFHAELNRNLWHCFSQCKGGGNQLDFVAKKEGISVREAALRLQTFFLAGGGPPATAGTGTPAASSGSSASALPSAPRPPAPASPESPHRERNPILNVRLQLKHEHEHLTRERGLTVETLQHFDVGYCSRGIMRGLICFPIHDEDGQLVAYAGRRLRPSDIKQYGKYKLPTGFRKELVLYNLHRCREKIAEQGVVLLEGFFTVLKLYEAGIGNVVASMGCELSDHQATLLKTAKDVIVLYDGDEAGGSGAELAKEKLEGKGVKVRLARLPQGTKPDDLSPKALRWLVNGLQQLDLEQVSFWVTLHHEGAGQAPRREGAGQGAEPGQDHSARGGHSK